MWPASPPQSVRSSSFAGVTPWINPRPLSWSSSPIHCSLLYSQSVGHPCPLSKQNKSVNQSTSLLELLLILSAVGLSSAFDTRPTDCHHFANTTQYWLSLFWIYSKPRRPNPITGSFYLNKAFCFNLAEVNGKGVFSEHSAFLAAPEVVWCTRKANSARSSVTIY